MKAILVFLVIANVGYFFYRGNLYEQPISYMSASSRSAVDSVYLLSENSNSILRKRELELVVSNPQRENLNLERRCEAIGAFADVFEAQVVLDRLLAIGLEYELRAIDMPVGENDFRVMLPAAASLQDAFRKLRELKSQNIDSYVITQGEEALSVSLGVFSTEDAAKALQQTLLSSGYSAEIVELPQFIRDYWIFPKQSGLISNITEQLWVSLLKNSANLEKKLQQCAEIPH